MTSEADYHKNKLPGKTYITKRIGVDAERKLRIASKVMDGDAWHYAVEKGEFILRQTPARRKEIVAKFYEDDRRLVGITLQSFNGVSGLPQKMHFSFVGQEIPNLLKFFADIAAVQFPDAGKINMTDEALQNLIVSKEQATSLVHDNQDVFSEVVRSALTKADVVALGYRKKQVAVFDKLLNDRGYFDEVKVAKKSHGDENLWQSFFEKNEWIFGYGLSYLYVSSFEDKQLEQVVQGHDFINRGKRADAVMRTRGIASALCFVEIKTHETALLDSKSYRPGCWAPSKDLSGAVAQVQGTVASAMKNLSGRLRPTDDNGNPTGEEVFNFKPRAFLVVGSLGEFVTEFGVNEQMVRSFELYRNSIEGIEILTFDEVFERSRFIAEVPAQ